MTVEALIFITLGLLAVGLIIKVASSSSSKRKSDIGSKRSISDKLKLSGPLPGNGNGHGLDVDVITKELEVVPGHGLELDVITKELEVVPSSRDAAPTAELQAIGDIDAIQRAQILVNKGQIIEAVKYLCDNAGYELKKAVDLVDSMGKKVYPAD